MDLLDEADNSCSVGQLVAESSSFSPIPSNFAKILAI